MNKEQYETINNFNNDLKTYNERRLHVENTCDTVASMSDTIMREAMTNNNIAEILEKHATYLLNSSDVESGRKQEYGYYRDDKDYKSNYAMGERTVLTDNLEELEGYLKTNNEVAECDVDLISLNKMTPESKKRFLKYTFDDISDLSTSFQEKIKILIDNMVKAEKDEKNEFIIRSMVQGISDDTIADTLGISRRAVNKRLNKICNNNF